MNRKKDEKSCYKFKSLKFCYCFICIICMFLLLYKYIVYDYIVRYTCLSRYSPNKEITNQRLSFLIDHTSMTKHILMKHCDQIYSIAVKCNERP